ncbi:hypothetical protein FQZ97_1021680 [compost metagenome]
MFHAQSIDAGSDQGTGQRWRGNDDDFAGVAFLPGHRCALHRVGFAFHASPKLSDTFPSSVMTYERGRRSTNFRFREPSKALMWRATVTWSTLSLRAAADKDCSWAKTMK